MAWSGATSVLLERTLIIAFLIVGGALFGAAPSNECLDKWKNKPLAKEWLVQPAIKAFVESGSKKALVASALSAPSADFLLSSARELEQEVLSQCTHPSLVVLLGELQKAYLAKLGVSEKAVEVPVLFRALASTGDEFTRLTEVVRKLPKGKSNASGAAWIRQVYQEAALVEGVVVVGANENALNHLKLLMQRACLPRLSSCALWDPAFLYRVSVVPGSGQAAYIPETGVLVLSADLLDRISPLRQLVIAHELAHAATRRVTAKTGEDPREVFADFSGWRKAESGWSTPLRPIDGIWKDEIASDSKNSPYSVLPDAVLVAQVRSGELLDGFVFEKTLRETQKSGDLFEDIADHIAAYIVAPQRFCYRSKPVAPRKFEWVARAIFGQKQTLTCDAVP
jgi:hypothetical protein